MFLEQVISTKFEIELDTIVSVFLGAIIGMIVTFFTNFIMKRNAKRNLIQKLVIELNANLPALKQLVENEDILHKLNFSSPFWDRISASDILFELKPSIYEKVINIYVKIKSLQDFENSFSLETATETQKNCLKERRKDLLDYIENNKF